MKLVDLFCGAGGMSLGFARAGFVPVAAADFDPRACRTYARNLGPHVRQLDLLGAEADRFVAEILSAQGSVDVVTGGPPCQGFSVQRRGDVRDPRNEAVPAFARLSAALSPRAIVMENVPTLLGERGRLFVERAARVWEDAGYSVFSAVLQAADYGVPQLRKRAFVVAVRGGAFTFPPPTHGVPVTVREALRGLPAPLPGGREHPRFANHKLVTVSARNLERLRHVPEGGGRADLPPALQLPCHRDAGDHRHLDVYGRLWWDRPAGTITAVFDNFTRGRFAHPSEHRNITSREGARLQSFPDDFVFEGPKKDVARQIGNAVAPLLARAVAEAVKAALQPAEAKRRATTSSSDAFTSCSQIRATR